MSGETIVVFGSTVKTLASSGAAIANNAIGQAATANYGVIADGGGYPDADFVLTGSFATAPTENTVLGLYARPLDIDGTLDTDVPETTRPTLFIGSFVLNNVTTAQTLLLTARDLPRLADYYVHNNGSGQTLAAGWTLKATPRSYSVAV